MKKLILLPLFMLALFCSTSFSQDEMQKWMEYMTPGDMQKMLEGGAGTWKATMTMWMEPGAEPMKADASSTAEMILGGRYLQSKYKGDMMGMPFEGMALEGYDNAAKVFVSSWVDNMGTGMMYMTGTWNASSKQINYKGKMVDPMTGNWIDYRQDVTFNSDGTVKMEMYGPDKSGKEFKNMEINMVKQ